MPARDHPSRPAASRRGATVRAAVLVALLLAGWLLVRAVGVPDLDEVRRSVAAAGWWGPVLYATGYVIWAVLPAPKGVATAGAGILFGVATGSFVAWTGALVGAIVAFGLARVLGRDAVHRVLRGRLERADTLLGDHGFAAVLVARLVPVLPFTVLNYGAGVTGVALRPYVAASAVGMVPGTLAYAALGAAGDTDPLVTGIAAGVLVVLSLGGWWAARRRLAAAGPGRRTEDGGAGV